MASERKAKQEIEDLKSHIKKMQEAERKDRRKLAEEDAIKKIKRMEEVIADLQKHLAAQKQVSSFRTVCYLLLPIPCYMKFLWRFFANIIGLPGQK